MRKIYISIALGLSLLFAGCEDHYDTENNPVTYGKTYLSIDINTDKAAYKPGETVKFSLKDMPDGSAKVRYTHLGDVVKEEGLSGKEWSWTPPQDDFKGYMVDVYRSINGNEEIYASIAVDVSSDWTKFPRYGFLSDYGKKSDAQLQSTIEVLNRYHINGIQFYDWMYDHQRPLAGTVDNPASTWLDLIGRTNYYSTVKGYIDQAHAKGMKAMFYNLAFGALDNASSDGVKEEWYLFKDNQHNEKDNHHLDSPFRSSIYLTNPANVEWQEYLTKRNEDVYKVFGFDGYHIDQLGDRGTVYDYSGNEVDLKNTYKPFVEAMKQSEPEKYLVMNAVNQYGQENGISKSPVNFLYTEVWDPNKSFAELVQIILDNDSYSSNQKKTVLAAYMNYNISNSAGYINKPGILLANSVIFAFGGSHLEVGEHYLANEYFPNDNLQWKTDLREALINYYDFMVAYQNLLRGDGVSATYQVDSSDGKLTIGNWPASQGEVAVVGKKVDGRDIVHLINFSNANSMEWRDKDGRQIEPLLVQDAAIDITVSATPSKVWLASPDIKGGVAQALEFTKSGNKISLTIPSIKYWDMVVIEY